MTQPTVLILRTAGTNCDRETAYAFEEVGAATITKHINAIRDEPEILKNVQVVAIPGGFSYGDDVASGRVFAHELKSALHDELSAFLERGGYAIGICNGFQVLTKSGILPRVNGEIKQEVTLTDNVNQRYTDRWVRLERASEKCAWVPNDLNEIELPVAHAEGRFVADDSTLDSLEAAGQVALRYHSDDNFNGSDRRIAGICDPSGRVFGLMPHPERFLRWEHHPQWTRLPRQEEGLGIRLFRSAIQHLQAS